jgi:hypothetical protein
MLAAMCLISPLGHQLVQDGFSDSKISLGETFRFEWLISSLEAFGSGDEEEVEDESGMWEWRTAALGFINALTTSGIDLELRCDLRGEIRRRGFDHAVDVSLLTIHSIQCADEQELLDREPTDTFVVQAENYIEDRDEDLLELRQINLAAIRPPDDDGTIADSLDSGLEPEKHESHLAAIYEEVADLRTQVRPPFLNQADTSSGNQRMSSSTLKRRSNFIIVPSISFDRE